MFKRQHAAAFLLLCAGLTGSVAVTATGQEGSPAAKLLEQGLAEYQAGNLAAAKKLLIQIDPMTLPKTQRQSLYDAATEIQTQLDAGPVATEAPTATPQAPAEPVVEAEPAVETPADTLRRADQLAASDPGTAIAAYTALIEQGGETGNLASAHRADLLRQLNTDTTRAKALVDTAEASLNAGDLDAASKNFAAVEQSGADLGWFDQQRVARGLAKVQEARTAETAAEPQVAAAPTPAPSPTPTPAPVVVTPTPAASTPAAAPQSDMLAQAQRDVASDYLRDAKQAQHDGYDSLAANLLNQAAELDPNNPEIQNRLAATQQRQANGTNQSSALGTAIDDLELRRQQALATYQEAMTDASARLTAGDHAGASTDAARARQIMELNQDLFAKTQYEDLRQDAVTLQARIDENGKVAAIKEAQDIKTTQQENDAQAVVAANLRDQEKVRGLVVQARALQIEMKYEEALLLLDQALFKDPTNFTAELLKEVIEDAKVAVDYQKALRKSRLSVARSMVSNREATLAYQDILTYPTNWPEISEDRIRNLDATGNESQANRETANKLRKTVPIDFDANSLESVVDYLRQTTEANIFVNWAALEDAGVERDMPVSLTLSNISAEKALKLILQQITSAAGDLDIINYSIIDGVITISTENDLFRSKDLRVFDIRDLLVQVPNFKDAPVMGLNQEGSGGGGSGGGSSGGGGGGLFGDEDDSNSEDEEDGTLSRSELILEIISLIQETVGTTDEWENLDSTVRELNGNLIARTTPDNHREILGLLAKLRETRAIQISVEARFLLVDRNFMDEFGVDFDVNWEGDRTTPGFQPIAMTQNNNNIAAPDAGALSFDQFFTAPGAKALNLGVSFIDDISVNLIVQATLANRNAISLTAPRVTFFNGQRAWVAVVREISYIAESEPIPDAVGVKSTTEILQTGAVLDVEGTVSADRRYVTMTLRPGLGELVSLRSVQNDITITRDDDNDNNNGGGDGETTFVIPTIIQIPEMEITSVRCTVSVPDRGTLLVGGQRIVGESEIESGVPVLSKIPILNRLFTSTSKREDERTLLILIKPTIIIQNEQEEDLFPGINDKLIEAGQGTR